MTEPPLTEATRKRILIDTDPGIDDAMAIFYALASPELEVVGLTTVFGNAHTDVCTTNALRLLEIAGRSDVPVARGVEGPMAMPYRGPVPFVHGLDGQGNVFLKPPSIEPAPIDAAHFIIDTVRHNPGLVTVVALGPLTNVALALLLDPALGAQLEGIVLMGGNAFCGGNASPAAEANIINDPEAADIVFGADCPIVMAGLDVTEKTVMSAADLAQFAAFGNARAQHLAAITPYYRDFFRERTGLDGIFVHDSTTISYLLAPQHYTWVEHPIRVDCGHSFCRGKTQVAERVSDHETAWQGRGPVRILTGVDSRAVVELELDRLRR
ncbi:MAG TPA: nucleoside hydrolase [Ilumatobacteraceae bacterium]|nr:nucleoside hydrolase [Ilumatobacteraceae bacterium]